METMRDLTYEWQRVYEMLDDPEVPDEAIFDTIESIEATMDIKADHYAMALRDLELDIKKIDTELARLEERKARKKRRIESMKDRLEETMIATGRRKFETALFTFRIQKNGGVPPLDIYGDVPPQWTKPGVPDKDAIRAALKRGESLPFAKFGEVGEHLVIA